MGNTAMEKLSFLLLSIAVLWIALTLATPSTAEQGETDLIMGLKTLKRGLRSADAKRTRTKKPGNKRNKMAKKQRKSRGQARRNPKKNKNHGKGRNRKAKKGNRKSKR